MQQAEEVTFGGGGLDRAANLRSDEAALGEILKGSGACVLPVWKGKPLINQDGSALALVGQSHPVLTQMNGNAVFLGLSRGTPVFAADVSQWQPEPGIQTPEEGVFFDPSVQPLPESSGAFCELRGVMAALSPLDAEIAATARAILSWHRSHGFCAACGAKSDTFMAGWQRICPACTTHHFPRTDPVVIMLVTHGNSVLVGRSPGWPDGMNSLLAGFVEPGETIEAAVRREVFEETAIVTGAVTYLASQPWPYPSSIMIGCKTEALGREITLDPNELEDAFWLTREEVMDVFAGISSRMLPPREGAIASFLLKNWLADRLE
ncbi:MAG: NAD(+) diphosphatase [Rhodobacteraceae bacterium]|nr:NAD(+) diphosphatase [Paracoccaceae bacterium]